MSRDSRLSQPMRITKDANLKGNELAILTRRAQNLHVPLPEYHVDRIGGADHCPLFRAIAVWYPERIYQEGLGNAKSDAKRAAARALISILDRREHFPNAKIPILSGESHLKLQGSQMHGSGEQVKRESDLCDVSMPFYFDYDGSSKGNGIKRKRQKPNMEGAVKKTKLALTHTSVIQSGPGVDGAPALSQNPMNDLNESSNRTSFQLNQPMERVLSRSDSARAGLHLERNDLTQEDGHPETQRFRSHSVQDPELPESGVKSESSSGVSGGDRIAEPSHSMDLRKNHVSAGHFNGNREESAAAHPNKETFGLAQRDLRQATAPLSDNYIVGTQLGTATGQQASSAVSGLPKSTALSVAQRDLLDGPLPTGQSRPIYPADQSSILHTHRASHPGSGVQSKAEPSPSAKPAGNRWNSESAIQKFKDASPEVTQDTNSQKDSKETVTPFVTTNGRSALKRGQGETEERERQASTKEKREKSPKKVQQDHVLGEAARGEIPAVSQECSDSVVGEAGSSLDRGKKEQKVIERERVFQPSSASLMAPPWASPKVRVPPKKRAQSSNISQLDLFIFFDCDSMAGFLLDFVKICCRSTLKLRAYGYGTKYIELEDIPEWFQIDKTMLGGTASAELVLALRSGLLLGYLFYAHNWGDRSRPRVFFVSANSAFKKIASLLRGDGYAVEWKDSLESFSSSLELLHSSNLEEDS